MTDRIGISMVGAGCIARARHVPGFQAIAGVELVGVVNRSPESSSQAASEFGFAGTHGNWRELLDDPDVDAVVVATWPYLHAPVTLAALNAGKYVPTQARMAMNGDEAADMLSASLDHPELTTMIVPAPTSIWGDRAILRVLGNGALGDLRTMRLTWGGSVSGGAADPWRRQKRFSGSNMMAAGTQYECISRWLANALSMQARTERYETAERRIDGMDVLDAPDYVAIQAEFPARVHATIEIPAHTGNGGANQVLLFGSDATLQVDFDAKTLALAKRGSTDFAAVEIRPDERQGLARGSRVHRCDPWHGGGPPDGLRNRRPLHVVHGRSQPIGRIGAANAFVGSRKSETSIAGLRWTRQTAFVEEWRS